MHRKCSDYGWSVVYSDVNAGWKIGYSQTLHERGRLNHFARPTLITPLPLIFPSHACLKVLLEVDWSCRTLTWETGKLRKSPLSQFEAVASDEGVIDFSSLGYFRRDRTHHSSSDLRYLSLRTRKRVTTCVTQYVCYPSWKFAPPSGHKVDGFIQIVIIMDIYIYIFIRIYIDT